MIAFTWIGYAVTACLVIGILFEVLGSLLDDAFRNRSHDWNLNFRDLEFRFDRIERETKVLHEQIRKKRK